MVLVLVWYAALFVRWNLSGPLGQGLCCHELDGMLPGMARATCLARPALKPWVKCDPEYLGSARNPGSPLFDTVVAAQVRLVGVDSPLLLPQALLFLASLAALFLLAERLAGPAGALFALLMGVGIDLYTACPLMAGPMECTAVAFTPLVLLPAYLSRPWRSPLLPLVAGVALAGAVLVAWHSLLVASTGGLVLLLRAIRQRPRTRGKGWTLGLSVAAFVAPTVAAFWATRYAEFVLGRGFAEIWSRPHVSGAKTPLGMVSPLGLRMLTSLDSGLGWDGQGVTGLWSLAPSLTIGLVLALLAVGAVPVVWGSRPRPWSKLIPLLVVGYYFPLLAHTFAGGEHGEQVMVCALLSGSLTVGWLVGKLRIGRPATAVMALLVFLSMARLAEEWLPRSTSRTFSNLLSYGGALKEPLPTLSDSLDRRSWRGFLPAVTKLQWALLRWGPRSTERWVNTGLCTVGVGQGLPEGLLLRGVKCGAREESRRPLLWKYLMVRTRLGLAADDPARKLKGLPLASCPLESALKRPQGPGCRWLVGISEGGRSGPRAKGGKGDRLAKAVRVWAARFPHLVPRLVVERSFGRARVLKVWRLADR